MVDLESADMTTTYLKPADADLSRRRPLRKQQRQTSIVRPETKNLTQKDDLIFTAMRADGAQDAQSQARGREERGSSFSCESSDPSSSSTSGHGSKNSLILSVDDSSDAGSSDDLTSRGLRASASSESHNGDEDDDIVQKMNFFFQRTEKQDNTVEDFVAAEPLPAESTSNTTSLSKTSSLYSNLGKRTSLQKLAAELDRGLKMKSTSSSTSSKCKLDSDF